MTKRMKNLSTVGEVILAIGGAKRLGEITGTTNLIVANWKSREKFPAKTYRLIQEALTDLGFSAPDHLWGMQ